MKRMIRPPKLPMTSSAGMSGFVWLFLLAALVAVPTVSAQGKIGFHHPVGGGGQIDLANPVGPPSPPTEPTITRIATSGREIVVTVWVPAGKQRVTLECRPRLGPGSWVPESRQNLNGKAGEVEFRLPNRRELELLRVRAESPEDLPLPAAFYAGRSQFPGVVVTNLSNSRVFDGVVAPGIAPVAGTVAGTGLFGTADLQTSSQLSDIRAVAESDIWRLDGNTVYFFNQGRGLQVIDVTDADHPQLRASLPVAAYGEQMYLLPALGPAGERYVALLLGSGCSDGGNVIVAEISASGGAAIVNQLPFTGQLRESRLVGNVLYLASYWWHSVPVVDPAGSPNGNIVQWQSDTAITSYNLVQPAASQLTPATLSLPINPIAINATDHFLFVASTANPTYDATLGASVPGANSIEIIDISDPNGALTRRGSATTRGTVGDKFKISQEGDVLRVVSFLNSFGRPWATTNWFSLADGSLVRVTGGPPSSPKNSPPSNPELYRTQVFVQWEWAPVQTWLETFSLTDSANPVKLGELLLKENEQLFATRFAGHRAYVVTFRRIDPLFLVDLSDPTHPTVRGKLEVPGFSTYLSPLNDSRLLAMGLEGGQPIVSLFDVADMTQPKLISKIDLKSQNGWGYSEANNDEKAFNYSPEAGLILFPWQGWQDGKSFQTIQLIDLKDDALSRRGVINHAVTARRATVVGERVISISAAELLSVSIANRDLPAVTASVPLQYRVDRTWILGERLVQLSTETDPNGQSSRPIIQLAAQSAPEQPTGLLSLPAGLNTLGLELHGGLLHVLQQAPTTYRTEQQVYTNTVQEWVTHKEARLETNDSITIIPPRYLTTYTTNFQVVTQPQPPIKPIIGTNETVVEVQYPLFPTLVPYKTNIVCPPDLSFPCETNVFENVVWVELPPLIRTNRTYVYGPEIPQPDLVVTNEIVTKQVEEIPGQTITNGVIVTTKWYSLPPVLETHQQLVTNFNSIPVPGYLLASVVNCSGVAPLLVGQVRSDVDLMFNWGPLAAVWPTEDLLVWTDARESSYNYMPYPLFGPQFGGIADGMFQPSIILYDWGWGGWWGYQSQAHFLPVNVTDPSQPVVKSPITAGDTQTWTGLHSAHAANGSIYFSHETRTELPPLNLTNDPGTKPGGTDIIIGAPIIPAFWYQRYETHYHLDVLDLTDPVEARLRTPLPLPAPLGGISHGGNLLYTRGGVDPNGAWVNQLQALSYDGLQVNLIDTLPLPSSAVVLRDGGVAHVGNTNSPTAVESWSLGTDAHWHKYAELTLTGKPVLGLHAFPDGLVIAERENGNFTFLKSGALDNLVGLGDALGQCGLYPDWRNSDATITAGLWLARGPFGLWVIRPAAVPLNP